MNHVWPCTSRFTYSTEVGAMLLLAEGVCWPPPKSETVDGVLEAPREPTLLPGRPTSAPAKCCLSWFNSGRAPCHVSHFLAFSSRAEF